MGINTLSKAIGYLLFIVSCIFSVKLMIQFGASGFDKLVWAVCAIGMMATNFVCAVVTIRLVLHRRYGFAFVVGLLYFALYVVSVIGSIGFQSASSTDAQKQAGVSDEKKIMMEKTLAQIDREISESEKRASDFAARTVMSKGYLPEMERIASLKKERAEAYKALLAYKPEGNGAQEFWVQLANFAGSDDPDQVKFFCFFLIACLVDICGAAMVTIGFRTFSRFVENEPSEEEFYGHETHPSVHQATFDRPATQHTAFRDSSETEPVRFPERPQERYPVREAETDPAESEDLPDLEPARAQNPEKTRPTIGFRPPVRSTDVRGTEYPYERYVNEAFAKLRKGGHFPSRRIIAERIGISQAEADEIHKTLKKNGLVEVVESKTFPKKGLSETLAVLTSVYQIK